MASALRGFDGSLNLYVKDLSTGEAYGHNALTPTYLASTVKIPVMLEVLHQVDEGSLTLEDTVVFGSDDLRDGAGPVKNAAPGTRFTVGFLLDVMMGDSDNAATDLLIKRVGLTNVQDQVSRRNVRFGPITPLIDVRRRVYGVLHEKGASLTPQDIFDIWLQKGMAARGRALATKVGRTAAFTAADLERAFQSYYTQNVNTASMKEMGALLEQIGRCEGLSATTCARARALLTACRTGKKRIKAGLPAGVTWAHKTGTQHRRACDVGLLYLSPDRPVVVAACTRDFSSTAASDRLLARTGRAVWTALTAPSCHAPVRDRRATGRRTALPSGTPVRPAGARVIGAAGATGK